MPTSASRVLLAGLVAVAPTALFAQDLISEAAASEGERPGIVRCESNKGRPQTCGADVRGGVRVVRQLSRSPCVEGENWGVRDGQIWVKAGCRADFGLGDSQPLAPGPQFIKCESNSASRKHCAAVTSGGVQMIRQLSKSQCIQHGTWGYDRNSVWVSQGCRAEFQIGAGAPEPAKLGPQKVRCESDRGRERRCEVGVWQGATMTRQLSKTPCVQGHSWGWDQRGVWVSRGCRAEFTVW